MQAGNSSSRDVIFWLKAQAHPNNASAFQTLAQQIQGQQKQIDDAVKRMQASALQVADAGVKNTVANVKAAADEVNKILRGVESNVAATNGRLSGMVGSGRTSVPGFRTGGASFAGGGGGAAAPAAGSPGRGGLYADLARAVLPDHYVRSVFRAEDAYNALSGSGALDGARGIINRFTGRQSGPSASAAQQAMMGRFPASMQAASDLNTARSLMSQSGADKWPLAMQSLPNVPAGLTAHAAAMGGGAAGAAGGAASMSVTIAAVAPVAAAALAAAAAAGLGVSAINDIARGKAIGTGAGRYAQATMGGVTSDYFDEDSVRQTKSNYTWTGRAIQFSGVAGMAFDATRSSLLDTDERGVQAGQRMRTAVQENVKARARAAQMRTNVSGVEFAQRMNDSEHGMAGYDYIANDRKGLAQKMGMLRGQAGEMTIALGEAQGLSAGFNGQTNRDERIAQEQMVLSVLERQKSNLAEQRGISMEQAQIRLSAAQKELANTDRARADFGGARDAARATFQSGAAAFGGMNAGERMEAMRAMEQIEAGQLPGERGRGIIQGLGGSSAEKLRKLLESKGEEFGFGKDIGQGDKKNLDNLDAQFSKTLERLFDNNNNEALIKDQMKATAETFAKSLRDMELRITAQFAEIFKNALKDAKGGGLGGVGK